MAIKVGGVTVIDDSRGISNVSTITANGDISFTGTGYMRIPAGTTEQRPGFNTAGTLRFNTTTNTLEVNNGTTFGPVGGGASATGSDIYNAIAIGAL